MSFLRMPQEHGDSGVSCGFFYGAPLTESCPPKHMVSSLILEGHLTQAARQDVPAVPRRVDQTPPGPR